MSKKTVAVLGTLLFSFSVLFISVLRTASVKYNFKATNQADRDQLVIDESAKIEEIEIDYYPAYPGPVLPDHPLWPIKALRDRIWLILTTDQYKEAELNLLFADKRLMAAKILFEKRNYELGYTTLTKAEKYFERACGLEETLRERGIDTLDLTMTLIKASLKHRQIIKQILLTAPGDAIPKITLTENYTRGVWGQKAHVLQERGVVLPNDPFNGL